MDVHTEPGVIGQIPTHVIGIVVNGDLVGIPKPAVAIGDIKIRDAPSPAVKPETAWSATANAPNVVAPNEITGETTVLKRMVKVEVRIIAPGIVANPLAVVMYVGRFWMARLVRVTPNGRRWMWIACRVGSWSVCRGRTTANSSASSVLFMLRQSE